MHPGYLPPILKSPKEAIAMSPLRATNASFIDTGAFQSRNLSPTKGMTASNSLAKLSPREVVAIELKKSADCFGIDGYAIPKVGSPVKAKAMPVGKSKAPGVIEREARYRRNFPGAGQYTLQEQLPWDEQFSKVQSKPNFNKAKRRTEADNIYEAAKKPEKSTPGPSAYTYEKIKFLPRLNLGKGSSSLAG